MDDAALVLAARSGDRDALAGIYDRYADRLHDYCWSILRDRDEAADAFHDAFVVAAQRLDQLREPSKLRPWLYAIARHEALRRAKARRRQQPTDELDDVIAPSDAEPDRSARQDEAVQLVWAAAAGLADRDRALLDLNLRQGLEGQELADAIGVEPGHAYVLLNRLRAQVERSLGALLIARYGRSDCAELAKILEGWDGRFSPLLRKRVARHADGCDVCADRRRTLASPLALLSAMPLMAVPLRLRDSILEDAQLAAHAGGWTGGDGGFPPPMHPPPRGRILVAAAAAAVLVLGALGLLLANPFAADDEIPVAAVQAATTTSTAVVSPAPAGTEPTTQASSTTTAGVSTTTPTGPPATTTTTAPAVLPVGPRLALATDRLDFGTASEALALVLTNEGDAGLAWSAAVSSAAFTAGPASGRLDPGAMARVTVRLDRAVLAEGPLGATLQVTSDGGQGTVDLAASVLRPPVVRVSIDHQRLSRSPCSTGFTAASIQADIADESGVASAVLHWTSPTGASGSANLVPGGGRTYSGRLGPFTTAGTATWWVEATDTLGATGRSADVSTPVDPCR